MRNITKVLFGLLLLSMLAFPGAASPVTDGIVVYYDGNLSGSSLVDLSGNNNTGYATSVTQGINQTTGAGYINLDGVNSRIIVSDNVQTNISSPISIEFIGSVNNFTKYGALVSKYDIINNAVFGWYLSSSSSTPFDKARFGAGLTDGALHQYESNVNLVAGQVYHIVATYDNNTSHIYVNGMDSGSSTWDLPIAGINKNITIGSGSGLNYSNCSMYSFRLYNRALSSAEVMQNYENDRWRYNVIKATPEIIWSNPAGIIYGTALNETQLNAVAEDPVTGNNVAGNFTYTPAAGTVLGAGIHTLRAEFIPTDTANYTTASASVQINVSQKQVPDWSVVEGLVVYYDGNLSGNSLVDLSGNNNTGYATNVTQGMDPRTGTSYINLNGVNSKIDVSNNAQTNISSPVSIEFIGSINNFKKYGAIVSKYQDSTTGWYLSSSSSSPYNKACFGVNLMDGREINFDSNTGLVAGQVYHIVATYDNSTARIYINGVESGSKPWSSPIKGGTEDITIGYGSSRNGLANGNCSMYTFRLYNRSLSQDEVKQNYDNWICTLDSDPDITAIKKLVYGNYGLPRYMGSHAMSQSGSGVNLVDSNISLLGSVSTPYYQDNGSAETGYILLNSSISGVKWKNYYAPGSSASLSFSGNNRNRLENINLSNDSLHLSNSVTYTEDTLVTKEAVTVTGNAFQFYGDGLNTISGNTVQAYTDNGEIQKDSILIKNSPGILPGGIAIDNEYQNRTAGTTRSNSIELPISSPQLTPMPCPSGYLGSLSFAIHADKQDPDSLKTMMYGTNDTQSPVYGTKGYIGHGLSCTWSAFAASSSAGYGFDNASFKSILDEMYAHGFEIVPHNVIGDWTEGVPTLSTTAYYLPWYFDNYSSRNWIDHGLNGGNRNTGLKSLGLDKTSQYYIGDLLRQYGVQYAWAYQDINVSKPNVGLSTSQIQSIGLPYDIVWTNTNFTWDDGTPMYEWTSSLASNKTSLNYFRNDTIQTMIDKYEVCFWHDYTAQNDSEFEDYYYIKGNPNMINQSYDNLLLNISEQNTAGRLWNPTVSQYIDYWQAACNIECKCTGQNTYTLTSHNSAAITGYAMRVKGPYTAKLDGNSLNTKTNGGDTVFWMDLSPGTHLLTLARA